MSDFTPQELNIARQYDLTSKTIPFLDRHLVYPIVESLRDIYDDKVISQLSLDLFKDTYMTQFVKDQYKLVQGSVPAELAEKEAQIEKTFAQLNEETKEILSVLANQEVQDHLKQDKSLNKEFLETQHGITEAKINKLLEFGQFQYNRGDYAMASDLLSNFRILSTNQESVISATWGKLAADILRVDWEQALKELTKLREVVDSRSFSDPLTQLHNRTWVIHWSLFPFFNSENGLEQLLELFMSSSYLSTIQAASPWILRYLIAAVVSSENSTKNNLSNPVFQKRLKDLIRVVGQEQYQYRDPLTDFIKALYIDFDFNEANVKLQEASVILKTDFFLQNIAEVFLENSKHLITEVYCRVHQRIDIAEISKNLNLSKEEGEKWVAHLINETKMNAKINENEGTVILEHQASSVYQQVIEKTKALSFKANQIIASTLQKQE